jgi:hypothetical protein
MLAAPIGSVLAQGMSAKKRHEVGTQSEIHARRSLGWEDDGDIDFTVSFLLLDLTWLLFLVDWM